eukprot:scaffold2911_cov414-Prasinococcus_capsulatus_cf.AAC.53
MASRSGGIAQFCVQSHAPILEEPSNATRAVSPLGAAIQGFAVLSRGRKGWGVLAAGLTSLSTVWKHFAALNHICTGQGQITTWHASRHDRVLSPTRPARLLVRRRLMSSPAAATWQLGYQRAPCRPAPVHAGRYILAWVGRRKILEERYETSDWPSAEEPDPHLHRLGRTAATVFPAPGFQYRYGAQSNGSCLRGTALTCRPTLDKTTDCRWTGCTMRATSVSIQGTAFAEQGNERAQVSPHAWLLLLSAGWHSNPRCRGPYARGVLRAG